MMKKTLLALVLAGTSFASQANWQAGVGYVNLSDSEGGDSISLNALVGSLGYKFKTGDKVSIIESKPFSKNKKFQVMENTK